MHQDLLDGLGLTVEVNLSPKKVKEKSRNSVPSGESKPGNESEPLSYTMRPFQF